MPAPNHSRDDLYITEMVLARLPMLSNTQNNQDLISLFIFEVMSEMEVCFKVDEDLPEGDDSRVGNEEHYDMVRKMVTADIVSVYLLMRRSLMDTAGVAGADTDGVSNPRIITKSVAGSVEVEWEQLDIKKGGGMHASSAALINRYQDSATRKGAQIGCIIAWDEGMTVACEINYTLPIKVVTHCDKHHQDYPISRA